MTSRERTDLRAEGVIVESVERGSRIDRINLEDDYMEIDLNEKPDVKSLKVPPGPPSSTYSPSEENILIKLKLGNCSMEEVERYKEELKHETSISKTDIENKINLETQTLNELIETKHSEAIGALNDMKENQKPIEEIDIS